MQSLLVLFISSALVFCYQSDSTWNKEKEENGVIVYTRTKAGKSYLEYRTDFHVNASLARVKEIITDVALYKKWMPSTLESRIVRRVSDSVFYAYTVTDTPWPASNRDLAFKGTVKKTSANSYEITYKEAPSTVPENSKYVRIKAYHAVWKLEQITPSQVRVSFVLSFDPGSTYPNWMIKSGVISARIEVAKKLRERV